MAMLQRVELDEENEATNPTNELIKTEQDAIEYFGDKPVRWVQKAVRGAVEIALENKIRTNLVVLPTGVGKTVVCGLTIASPRVRKALNVPDTRPLRVLFIAHLHRLLTQAERTFGEQCGVEIKLTTPFTDIDPAIFEWADIVFLDECHHESCSSIQLQLSKMAHKPFIGLTATPDRADGMVIKFENIIQPITREQAVAEGWLAETSLWSFIDTSSKNKTQVVKQILNQYIDIMDGTLVFMRTIKEVIEINKHINQLGYKSVALTNQKPDELNDILDSFSRGEIQFLINCSRLGEGIDVIGCTSVVFGCTVGSYPKLNQYVGRAARPDTDCRIFELVNPLSGRNLDVTAIVGTPKKHTLCSPQPDGTFKERLFNYVRQDSGIESVKAIGARRRG